MPHREKAESIAAAGRTKAMTRLGEHARKEPRMTPCLNCGTATYPEPFCDERCAEEFQRYLDQEVADLEREATTRDQPTAA